MLANMNAPSKTYSGHSCVARYPSVPWNTSATRKMCRQEMMQLLMYMRFRMRRSFLLCSFASAVGLGHTKPCRMQRRWKKASRATKRKNETSCSMMEARSIALPALMSASEASRSAILAPPFPVIAPMTASSPRKVEMTRPGWIALRYGT